jgi:hypothetical protein
MNPYTSSVFNTSVKSKNSSPNYMNDLKDCDALVTAWSLSYGKSIQNGNDPVTRYILNTSNPVLLTPGDHRTPITFNPEAVDIDVGMIINSSQNFNSEMQNSSDPSEWIDSLFVDEPSMPIEMKEFSTSFYPKLPSPVSFSYSQFSPQFTNSHPNSIVHALPPMDNCRQQSSSCYFSGLQYHPFASTQTISPPCYYFGSTQVAPYTADIQVQPTLDFNASSLSEPIKKPIKAKQKGIPPCPGSKSGGIDMNDWYVKDENGKKRRPFLHEFLRILLDNEKYSHIAKYVDKGQGIFKFYDRNKAAELWELVKARNTDISKFHSFHYYLKDP